jgi:hypothetical protein
MKKAIVSMGPVLKSMAFAAAGAAAMALGEYLKKRAVEVLNPKKVEAAKPTEPPATAQA